jgi:3D-(3,5/4)-trihydroxycyclohexane-1,2-dione acylhydrolase (decyclizing)
LAEARKATQTTVVYIKNDRLIGVPGHGWWDVPPAEISERDSVRDARAAWEKDSRKKRRY